MKKETIFTCNVCGYQTPRWLGKCPDCNTWGSLEEETFSQKPTNHKSITEKTPPSKLSEIKPIDKLRISTGIGEMDRALGGGIVLGSVTLIGGDPGIGKSTILMQASGELSKKGVVLYVSGEESAEQIKLRAQRMNIVNDNIYLVCENDLETILGYIDDIKPNFVVIDSIQTMHNSELSSAGGTVSQVRSCCEALTKKAKTKNIPLFIVSHVTKDGTIAGPKVLEHIVDTVLYFEGDKEYHYRILRCIKNRFGSTDEIGIFEMNETGLECIQNPSAMFLEERSIVSGSVVVPIIEGTRPILVEIQALVVPSYLNNPRRMCQGLDYNRFLMIIAVLEKRIKINLSNKDVLLNVVGGMKITETAADLSVACAIASSLIDTPINSDVVAIGEVGLAGEVRRVSQIDKRINEATRLGFTQAVLPNQPTNKTDLTKVSSLREAIDKIITIKE